MVWWTWLAACGPVADGPAGESDGVLGAETGRPVDTHQPSEDTDATAVVPLIDEALATACGDPPTPPTAPVGSGSLHRLTLGDPAAVCNDGSPAVLFVRPASDPAHADDWVIHLEGGFFCEDWQTCAARWCTQRGLMSSRGQPEQRDAVGIVGDEAANPLGGYNHVLVEYCSSDLWSGRTRDQVIEGEPSYRLHFAGHDILGAMLDTLSSPAPTSDDGAVTLASLADAGTVVYAGSSAGGWGAAHSLDWVAERLDARVIGVIDGMLQAAGETLDPVVVTATDRTFSDRWDRVGALFDPFVDATCAAAIPGAEAWRCADTSVLQPEHLSTPFVVTADLADPVVGDPYFAAGLTTGAWAIGNELTLRALVDGRPDVGAWASRCARHTTLRSTEWYRQVPVQDAVAGGTPRTVAQVIAAFVEGERLVAVAGADGTGVGCP